MSRTRPLSAPIVVLLALSVVFGVSGAGAAASSERLYAGMPTPEAFADPADRDTASTAWGATTYDLSRTTIRFRAGSYNFYRFTDGGKLLRQRTIRFSYAVGYRAAAQPELIGNRWFTRITGGRYLGWHVATPEAQPSSVTKFDAPKNIQLAATSYSGVRFYANGWITTRRIARLYTAQTVEATKRATFSGRQYVFLSSGPLAGRWVAQAATAEVEPTPTTGTTGSGDGSTSTGETSPKVTWNTLVLVYRETDVTFTRPDGSSYRLRARMSDYMYDLGLNAVRRTVGSVKNWSGSMANLDMQIVDVPHPLTAVDPLGSGYWVSPRAVRPDLDTYAPAGRFDSIIVLFQPKDADGVAIPIPGWGLTVPNGPWANGAGFSSVKAPLENWWWTDTPYPEEVFIHEWMHQVLFYHLNTGETDVDLHAAENYGYTKVSGTWKAWLADVMQGRVQDGGRYLGMEADAWAAGKPTAP
ncbi:MAG TPA: hypothetical protein VK992_03220 [Candidatus Caenarcaniphilales bacterium]|nr:hypothetical protein [Candidatus Caenarcaniphilales bacterium]